jgi:hypothetical protein
MTEHACPICARGKLHRSERRGLLENHFYPLFGKFPWRCNLCHSRVQIADRGARQYVRAHRESPSKVEEQPLVDSAA